jgi:hypothetical protein
MKTRMGKKDQSNSGASSRLLGKMRLTAVFVMICFACAVSLAGTSKLYPPAKDEAGSLRVAQVVNTATRQEIIGLKDQLQHLLASGLTDSDLKDGSLASGRVYCCHPRLRKRPPCGFMFLATGRWKVGC